jgi:hypothetical protein
MAQRQRCSATRAVVYARDQLDLKIHELEKTNGALQAEITERKRAEVGTHQSKIRAASFKATLEQAQFSEPFPVGSQR